VLIIKRYRSLFDHSAHTHDYNKTNLLLYPFSYVVSQDYSKVKIFSTLSSWWRQWILNRHSV